jgi:transforming growth factor-beta-induced protein
MRSSLTSALLLSLVHLGRTQGDGGLSLGNAIANYTELSQFAGLLNQSPGVVSSFVPQTISGITILIPSNKALDKFVQQTGQSLTALPTLQIQTILQYHVLAAKMTSRNFTAARRGLTIPTLLKDKLYNNRSAGPELVQTFGASASEGNVLFISPDPISQAKLRVRQQGSSANARGGLGGTSSIDAVDGTFDMGYFQIIDTVLAPPSPCSATIRTLSNSLMGLDNALNRSGLYPVLDTSPNVTCLAPNNAAFKSAGDPDANLNVTALSGALL